MQKRVAQGVANISKILHSLGSDRHHSPTSKTSLIDPQVPSRDSLRTSSSLKQQDPPAELQDYYSSQDSNVMGSTKGSAKADSGVKAKAPRIDGLAGYRLFFTEHMQKWQEEREHAKAKKGKKPLVSQIAGKHWKALDDKEKAKWNEKGQKQASGGKKMASVTKKK